MRQYTNVSGEIKALEKEKDNIKANILINMKMSNIDNYESDTSCAKYSMQKRRVLDKLALGKFLVTHNTDIDAFQKINEFEMLRVTEKNNLIIEVGDDENAS
jgi:hypothetical protein